MKIATVRARFLFTVAIISIVIQGCTTIDYRPNRVNIGLTNPQLGGGQYAIAAPVRIDSQINLADVHLGGGYGRYINASDWSGSMAKLITSSMAEAGFFVRNASQGAPTLDIHGSITSLRVSQENRFHRASCTMSFELLENGQQFSTFEISGQADGTSETDFLMGQIQPALDNLMADLASKASIKIAEAVSGQPKFARYRQVRQPTGFSSPDSDTLAVNQSIQTLKAEYASKRFVFFDAFVKGKDHNLVANGPLFSRVLESSITKYSDLFLLDRSARDTLFLQRKFNLSDCTKAECRFAMVRALPSIDYIIEVHIEQFGKQCAVGLSVKGARDGRVASSVVRTLPCLPKRIVEALPGIVAEGLN